MPHPTNYYVPTPEEIAEQCERFRRENEGRHDTEVNRRPTESRRIETELEREAAYYAARSAAELTRIARGGEIARTVQGQLREAKRADESSDTLFRLGVSKR